MAFDNTGFETEDAASLGYPDGWTILFVSGSFLQAGFDDGSAAPAGLTPIEAFEGAWLSNENFVFAYEVPLNPSEIIGAFFDSINPEGVEDFEEEWNSNQFFLFSWGSAEEASYDSGTPELGEDFEEEWNSNESFSFSMGSTTAALFDSGSPESVEDLEEEWNSNESFDFTMGSTTAASYDSGGTPEAFEDFEEVLGPFTVSANSGTDRLTKTSHGLSDNQTVILSNVGGELPGGLNEGYEYFVINATANDFQLAATSGGSVINLTTVGVGTHTVTPDSSVFWVKLMETL